MKLGKGPLELVVVGASLDTSKTFLAEDAAKVMQSALSIAPLAKIFRVCKLIHTTTLLFGTFEKLEMYDLVKKRRPSIDAVVFIYPYNFNNWGLGGRSIINADTNPALVAHELGHALGLEHPKKDFCLKCEYPRDSQTCEGSLYLMCIKHPGLTRQFSPSDMAKLISWYLK